MGGFLTHWRKSTFKRELAIIAFLLWAVITVWVFRSTDVAIIGALNPIYGTMSTAVWLFIMSAFGMDFAAKQWSNRTVSVSQINVGGENADNDNTALEAKPKPKLTAGGALTG